LQNTHDKKIMDEAGLTKVKSKKQYKRTRVPFSRTDKEYIQSVNQVLAQEPYIYQATPYSPVKKPEGVVAYYQGDTEEAAYWCRQCSWITNPHRPAVDATLKPDVLLVRRVARPEKTYELGDDEWSRDALFPHTAAYIEFTTLVIDAVTHNVVALYVTEDRDPAVQAVVDCGWQLSTHASKLYPRKRRHLFYGRHDGRLGHMGKNWLDGIQKFPNPKAKGGFATAFYLKAPDQPDMNVESAMLYTGMQTLEAKHAPAVTAFRIDKAIASHLPCILPGLDMADMACSCTGLSLNFACPPHIDSSVPGTTETMFFGHIEGESPYPFHILDYNVMFNHRKAVGFYMCCTLLHGTPPQQPNATSHKGVGMVIMSKNRNVGGFEATRQANENLANHAILKPLDLE
jgi:hypothetical protein